MLREHGNDEGDNDRHRKDEQTPLHQLDAHDSWLVVSGNQVAGRVREQQHGVRDEVHVVLDRRRERPKDVVDDQRHEQDTEHQHALHRRFRRHERVDDGDQHRPHEVHDLEPEEPRLVVLVQEAEPRPGHQVVVAHAVAVAPQESREQHREAEHVQQCKRHGRQENQHILDVVELARNVWIQRHVAVLARLELRKDQGRVPKVEDEQHEQHGVCKLGLGHLVHWHFGECVLVLVVVVVVVAVVTCNHGFGVGLVVTTLVVVFVVFKWSIFCCCCRARARAAAVVMMMVLVVVVLKVSVVIRGSSSGSSWAACFTIEHFFNGIARVAKGELVDAVATGERLQLFSIGSVDATVLGGRGRDGDRNGAGGSTLSSVEILVVGVADTPEQTSDSFESMRSSSHVAEADRQSDHQRHDARKQQEEQQLAERAREEPR